MKKVAIVGLAPSYKDAPYNDESFEIWGLNDGYDVCPRIDRLFEIHHPQLLQSYYSRFQGSSSTANKPHLQNLAESNIPIIYMQNQYEQIPNSKALPLDKLLKKFRKYFTSTAAYMVAMAIMEGFKVIHLYGCNMISGEEYGSQRPSVEYFLGYAEGLGIELVIHESSDLLKQWYLYGYDDLIQDEYSKKLIEQQNFINKRLREEEQITQTSRDTINFYKGAAQATKEMLDKWR